MDVTARPRRGLSGVNPYISCVMPLTLRLPRPFWIVALALCAAGCHPSDITATDAIISNEPTEPGIQAGFVSVTPTSDGIVVVNQTSRPIYVFAVNAETLALLDWAPCTGGPSCPALAQGEQRVIPWVSVYGYAPNAKQYSVMWWHAVVMPDGTTRPSIVQGVLVTR